MSPKQYFSYIRVSTQRQGQLGTSLTEQIEAIERYARRFNLQISRQFEERETAAKQGRPVFLDMLKELRKGKAAGLIMHKIDRSARNLKDWADLGSLIDTGVEVLFANESLDLSSRGGRLSADIQAVVAADYIRNLREEAKKGIYGRLKQGLFPFQAKIGYLDAGAGNPKKIDPVQGPLVKKAFELYATGDYSLASLTEKMDEMGLRTKNGRKVCKNTLRGILINPFYMGLIKIKTVKELYTGKHEPLITRQLFDEAQNALSGKNIRKVFKHSFLFRRCLLCRLCRRKLIAEKQKEHIYYRCQTKTCPQKSLRQEAVEKELLEIFKNLQFCDREYTFMQNEILSYQQKEPERFEEIKKQLLSELSVIKSRSAKLADAYVDEVFDKETYVEKKNELAFRQQELIEKLETEKQGQGHYLHQMQKFLELLKSAYLSYIKANDEEKREMVKLVFSNLLVEGKSVLFEPNKPFDVVLNRALDYGGGSTLSAHRSLKNLFQDLVLHFRDEAIPITSRTRRFVVPRQDLWIIEVIL
jgi:DNA invertase Pin-like site-specific DNA recombinase